ncbi:hypothetical protein [Rosistilla oblonga]|uniref:hypothetical protein n=1 Tax=Rosistilla oblonga TaxID=2527990 RepID=UPI00119F7FEC|nr:hypothetical protein [Rosistilla oblonga]
MKWLKLLPLASIGFCGWAVPAVAQGPAAGYSSNYAIDPVGLGMWAAPPAPHLVIRSPQKSSHLHHNSAIIPGATAVPVWKEPYAYGYFGAKPRQHPYRSFGHQQAYTEWRWR